MSIKEGSFIFTASLLAAIIRTHTVRRSNLTTELDARLSVDNDKLIKSKGQGFYLFIWVHTSCHHAEIDIIASKLASQNGCSTCEVYTITDPVSYARYIIKAGFLDLNNCIAAEMETENLCLMHALDDVSYKIDSFHMIFTTNELLSSNSRARNTQQLIITGFDLSKSDNSIFPINWWRAVRTMSASSKALKQTVLFHNSDIPTPENQQCHKVSMRTPYQYLQISQWSSVEEWKNTAKLFKLDDSDRFECTLTARKDVFICNSLAIYL